jgi:glucosylceramidase
VATGVFTISSGLLGPAVSVVLSTDDRNQLMAAQPSLNFVSAVAGANDNIVLVDENQPYQAIEGFGAAFTDSAAYLLKEVAQPDQLASTMNDLFTRNGAGIGLSFMRNPMGASDIDRSIRSTTCLPARPTPFWRNSP